MTLGAASFVEFFLSVTARLAAFLSAFELPLVGALAASAFVLTFGRSVREGSLG